MSGTAFPPDRYRRITDGLGRLAGGAGPSVLVQAEAVVALEALAHGIGLAGRPVLSIESSRYGRLSTGWLRAASAQVTVLELPDGEAADPQRVDDLLRAEPNTAAVVFTQAEVLTGVAHPADDIVEVAHRHDAAVAVDAVAAVGGLAAPRNADAVVIGPQKALDGPSGLSVATLSERGWALLGGQDETFASVLSLPYLRHSARDQGVPGTPSVPELEAAERALAAVEAEGIEARIARHHAARAAIREGLRAMGLTPWVVAEQHANTLATTVEVPPGADARELAGRAVASGGHWVYGGSTERGAYLQVSHYGRRAALAHVLGELAALGRAAGHFADVGDAAEAASEAWHTAVL
ncbi:aminotransferase class V-fold PLP-dependent enzyme [Streptomyces shenzhenensis]|uniref:aminotransferase class V-fold PLP-dependent enzyme n=1 Tax=Streptomyces shenzhenensis TaxID=943815 RepID=UPI0033F25098